MSFFSYNHLKIWFDILTPKEILFFESMVCRLEKKHTILCTSRNYREVNELGKIRNLALEPVGRFGGGKLSGKLDAGIDRMRLLSRRRFKDLHQILPSVSVPRTRQGSHLAWE